MKFEIVKNRLLSSLNDINGIIEKNSPVIILTHMFIEAKNNKLTLIGTDTELTLSAEIPANVLEEGRITIPSDRFTQYINRLPENASISCNIENDIFHIHSKQSHFQIQTLPAEDFPIPEENERLSAIELDASALFNLLVKIRFSMSENDARHYLNGINFQLNENQLESAATDGHRLSVIKTKIKADNINAPIIIPSKAVNALVKQSATDTYIHSLNLQKNEIEDLDEINNINDKIEKLKENKKLSLQKQAEQNLHPVRLEIGERELSLKNGHYRLTTRLLDGVFPNYQQIIPERKKTPILLNRKSLIEALQRSKVILNKKEDSTLIFNIKNHEMELIARNAENESTEEKLEIINVENLELNLGININYLMDVLNVIECETIQLHIYDNNSPILITNEEENNLLYVIMPIRID